LAALNGQRLCPAKTSRKGIVSIVMPDVKKAENPQLRTLPQQFDTFVLILVFRCSVAYLHL